MANVPNERLASVQVPEHASGIECSIHQSRISHALNE